VPPRGATCSVPVRRPLVEETVVVGRHAFAPSVVGVINALVRQNQDVLIEGDNPIVVICHAGSLMAEGDILWRRPEACVEHEEAYSGPPVGEVPLPGWRPEPKESAPPPRRLPVIDDDAVNAAEREAARLTHAVGVIAVVILVVIVCWQLF
jgi:hypothetical protein